MVRKNIRLFTLIKIIVPTLDHQSSDKNLMKIKEENKRIEMEIKKQKRKDKEEVVLVK